jgi:hypothetical protein
MLGKLSLAMVITLIAIVLVMAMMDWHNVFVAFASVYLCRVHSARASMWSHYHRLLLIGTF